MEKTAIVVGATGLVGSELVRLLMEDDNYNKIKIFTRRTLSTDHIKIEEYIVDFDLIDEWKSKIAGDVLFSAMGTTIRKAGGKKQQYKIDFTFQYEAAKAASENGVDNYVLVSSMGANSKSTIFYSRMKGQLDDAVRELPFNHVYIMRPSALVGTRSEERAGEKFMIQVTSNLVKILPFLKKYKPIDAKIVAKSMINVTLLNQKEVGNVFENLRLFMLVEP